MSEYPTFVLKGIPPWDGRYEWDIDRALNVREWRYIKKISGYLPATMDGGLEGDDPELYVALAVVCMVRAGKVDKDDALRVAEQIGEAPFDNASLVIQMPPKDEEEPEVPLVLTPPPDGPSRSETGSSPRSSDETASGSGKTSTPSSGRSDATPEPTGITGSDTAAAPPLRWAN